MGVNNGYFPGSPCEAHIHIDERLLESFCSLQTHKPSMGLEVLIKAMNTTGKRLRNAPEIDVRSLSEAYQEYIVKRTNLNLLMGIDGRACPACFHSENFPNLCPAHADGLMKLTR